MKWVCRNVARVIFLAIALVAVTACGGGGSTPTPTTPPPPPPLQAYSIGGTVSGLVGQGLVLGLSGPRCPHGGGWGTHYCGLLNTLPISANGKFVFHPTPLDSSSYAVAVYVQPSGEICGVTSGSGIASANVTSVAVACVTSPPVSIGGSVSGLVGQGLELQLFLPPSSNRGHGSQIEVIPISGNGAFVFGTTIAASNGSYYAVRIAQQPGSPVQRCVVSSRYALFAVGAANVTDANVACGEISYVTNAVDNTIVPLAVDSSTGALASVGPPVAAGQSPYAIASSSDKKYLYVGNTASNDVSVFVVDPGSGPPTTIPGSPFAAGTKPRALLFYSTWAASYAPYPVSYLYVANAGSNDVSAYSVDRGTGVPAPISPASYATGAGPSAMAIASPSNFPFLYTANTGGSNDISAFMIDVRLGSLLPVPGTPFPLGSTVSSLAVGVGGKFLYGANASGSGAAIYGFTIRPFVDQQGRVDPNAGALTPLPGFPYAVPSCNYIAADQTGTYLYATAGANVLGYSIDAQTGALNPLSGFPMAVGGDATSLSIDPTNQFLYVANGSAGTVTGFNLNAATGELSIMPGSPFTVGTSADFIATF